MFLHNHMTNQYNRYVSRGVYTPDVLVQWLDGSVAVVVCDGEHQHIPVCPVNRPAGPDTTGGEESALH